MAAAHDAMFTCFGERNPLNSRFGGWSTATEAQLALFPPVSQLERDESKMLCTEEQAAQLAKM